MLRVGVDPLSRDCGPVLAAGRPVHSFPRMTRGELVVMSVVAALWSGCGGAERCEGDCPAIGGVYQIDVASPTAACEFTPWLIGPSLELVQSEDGGGVSTTLIDPVNQLPVQLSGDVLSSDEPGIAVFDLRAQTNRQPTQRSTNVATFQLLMSGSVSFNEDPARLTATMTMTQLFPNGELDCQDTLAVSGRALDATGAGPSDLQGR